MLKKNQKSNNHGCSALLVKEKLPLQKRQNTTQTTEQEAVAESSNIVQPPVITMEC
ncbi:15108_t:CDS:2 [Funneliformis caledonium]|uniref:15108_t:CDS:1 n=1 Tax=Funneliformis caledonium TaxID=1117310 RepID=A0A9N9ADC8_9GLOM|nr:15108_t:CDS:2 [Funneliformis caledonium]